MAIPVVAAPAALLFGRRRIGSLLVVAGFALVAFGFISPLSQSPIDNQGTGGNSVTLHTPVVTLTFPNTKTTLALVAPGSRSAFDLLRHVADHPVLSSGGLGSTIVDVATRGSVGLIALGAALCLLFNFLPLMRGLVGAAAGIGFIGTGLLMGVIYGERTRTLSLCPGTICHIDPHAGIWLIAGGFALALVGGALGALRPLAGLVSGLSFAVAGVALGAGVAYLIVQQRVLDSVTAVTQLLPH